MRKYIYFKTFDGFGYERSIFDQSGQSLGGDNL